VISGTQHWQHRDDTWPRWLFQGLLVKSSPHESHKVTSMKVLGYLGIDWLTTCSLRASKYEALKASGVTNLPFLSCPVPSNMEAHIPHADVMHSIFSKVEDAEENDMMLWRKIVSQCFRYLLFADCVEAYSACLKEFQIYYHLPSVPTSPHPTLTKLATRVTECFQEAFTVRNLRRAFSVGSEYLPKLQINGEQHFNVLLVKITRNICFAPRFVMTAAAAAQRWRRISRVAKVVEISSGDSEVEQSVGVKKSGTKKVGFSPTEACANNKLSSSDDVSSMSPFGIPLTAV